MCVVAILDHLAGKPNGWAVRMLKALMCAGVSPRATPTTQQEKRLFWVCFFPSCRVRDKWVFVFLTYNTHIATPLIPAHSVLLTLPST